MSSTIDNDPFLTVAGAPQVITDITDKLLNYDTIPAEQSGDEVRRLHIMGSVMLSGVLDTYPKDQQWVVFYNAYSRAQDIAEEIREIRGAV